MKNTIFFWPVLILFLIIGCTSENSSDTLNPPESAKEKTVNSESINQEDWIYLFDGNDATGWRSFNGTGLPDGWIVEEGTLKSLGKGGDIGGDIVYGKKEFTNFELSMEWKISKAGNSGIFYHVQEGKQYNAAYENAPEYQVIDDIGYPDPLEAWQQVGADYAMHTADLKKKKVKPHGNWNSTRIIFTPEKVEHWLNGEKILEFVPWSQNWEARKTESKWKDYPDYGIAKTGLIGLQDHGSFIWYREIKIREL